MIRAYQEQDKDQVVALWTEVFPGDAPHNYPVTSIERKMAVDPELFLVAATEGSIIGTVMGGYDGHRGWIYFLAVKVEHRQRGVATGLMARMEQKLRARGCMKVNLQVRASNSGVVEFYQKLGYDVEQRISLGKRLYEPEERM